jgi:hypothetical protein
MANFDCVLAEYFNANIEDHRTFYRSFWQKDIDDPHSHDEENVPSEDQMLLHRLVNARLLVFTENRFGAVRLVFPNTDVNHLVFNALFPGRFWYGLGIGLVGLPVTFWLHTEDPEVDLRVTEFKPCLMHIYDVDDVRLNNLQHVISVDFVPDIYADPDLTQFLRSVAWPVPVPQPAVSRFAKVQQAREERQKKLQRMTHVGRIEKKHKRPPRPVSRIPRHLMPRIPLVGVLA